MTTTPTAEFTSFHGTAAELQPGDFIDTVGGPGFKLYRISQSVKAVHPQGRSNVAVTLFNGRTYQLSHRYPVRFRRAVTPSN